MRTHKEIFTEIYDKNIWGGSGGGSDPNNTVEYRALLQKFLKDKKIRKVVDYGCGDWAFSHLIDWTGIKYIGLDIVESVIKRNIKRYARPNIEFYIAGRIVGADLLILKDVLQHWPNSDIIEFLDAFRNDYKYILITNTASQEYDNQDIQAGDTRGLCARFEPLKRYNPEVLAVIHTTIVSEVLLITNE